MGAYNRLNGEACCASYCLIDLLRNQWGFESCLVSDNGALNDILKTHRLTDTIEDTAQLRTGSVPKSATLKRTGRSGVPRRTPIWQKK